MPPAARSPFYLWAAGGFLLVILAGFFTTYLRPVWRGEFHGGAVFHVHGALLLAWALLVTAQAWLVNRRNLPLHRSLGVLSLALVPSIVVSTVTVALVAMQRDLPALGEVAVSSVLGSITSPLIFASLVAAALVHRRRPEYHKRLMLLASVALLWPAFFRLRHYFPSVPRPDLVFGVVASQLVVVAAMAADRLRHGRVHPVYLWVGIPFIAEAFAETLLFDSAGWRVVARAVVGLFVELP